MLWLLSKTRPLAWPDQSKSGCPPPTQQLAPRLDVLSCDWEQLDASHPEVLGRSHALVILADCVWVEGLIEPLLSALDRVSGPQTQVRGLVQVISDVLALDDRCHGPLNTFLMTIPLPPEQVLLAHQPRSARIDKLFFQGLAELFDVQPIPIASGEPDRGKICLYLCHRKSDSP